MDRTTKQEEFDNQVQDFMERHPDYSTPGARSHWFKIKVGYIVLAFGCILGIWAISNHDSKNIKTQLNKLGVSSCIASIQTYGKFNDLIDSIVETRRETLIQHEKMHEDAQAKIDRQAIRRYQADKIVPPTVTACKQTVLVK